jgi:hypothetical protein
LKSTFSIKIGKQLAIFLRDEPGALAQVCETLAKHKINIDALAAESGGYFGQRNGETLVRMVVSHPEKALSVLGESGATAVETEVLMIETKKQPSAMAKISELLAQAKVNIESIYLSGSADAKKCLIILRPSNLEKAERALKDL